MLAHPSLPGLKLVLSLSPRVRGEWGLNEVKALLHQSTQPPPQLHLSLQCMQPPAVFTVWKPRMTAKARATPRAHTEKRQGFRPRSYTQPNLISSCGASMALHESRGGSDWGATRSTLGYAYKSSSWFGHKDVWEPQEQDVVCTFPGKGSWRLPCCPCIPWPRKLLQGLRSGPGSMSDSAFDLLPQRALSAGGFDLKVWNRESYSAR